MKLKIDLSEVTIEKLEAVFDSFESHLIQTGVGSYGDCLQAIENFRSAVIKAKYLESEKQQFTKKLKERKKKL